MSGNSFMIFTPRFAQSFLSKAYGHLPKRERLFGAAAMTTATTIRRKLFTINHPASFCPLDRM
jgi:hypothetical protein